MPAADVSHRPLPILHAKADNVAAFGTLLGSAKQEDGADSGFYAGHLRMSQPVDFSGQGKMELQLATLARRPGEVRYLERHFHHTQTFIPLAGKPFVMVLAPPSAGDMPDLAEARAFYFDGTQGFALHIGTWHEFPFALDRQTDIVVALSAQATADLTTRDPVTREAFGPDLDKKDMVARTNIVLTVDLDLVETKIIQGSPA